MGRLTKPSDSAVGIVDGDDSLNSDEDFDRLIRQLATDLLPPGSAVREAAGDALVIGPITTTLGNLRRAWIEHDRAERVPWLKRTVAAFVGHQPLPEAPDLSRLRPTVRSRTSIGLAALRLGLERGGLPAGSNLPSLPIAGDLAWTVVWDTPAIMDPIDEDQVDRWGYTFDELLGVAKTNLAMQPFLGWNVIDDRLYAPTGLDDYDGTRIFLPGALDFLPFDGDRVVFHPTRSSCAVVSADDPDAIALAADHALTQLSAANRVSLTPIVGRTGHWRPLQLESGHPAYDSWRQLIAYDRAAGYDTQDALLRASVGDDAFVAKHVLVEDPNGALSSYCTWSRDVETLLPVTDRVALYEENTEPFLVPWVAAVEVCGELLEPTNHYPERVRVREFPSSTELSILRGVAS